MKDAPAISILTTVFNRESFLAECIQSVLNSRFEDFELIIVDDQSTDRSLEIAHDFASKDSRIRVYRNEENLGDYPNRNKAASYARGKYLKYLDADDLIYPWGLQILWDSMELFPDARWGLCSLVQNRDRQFPFQLNSAEAYQYHYLGPGLFHKAPLSSIIRRDLFEEVGGFRPGRMVSDNEMWHRLALKNSVVLMCDGVVWYREHDDQESVNIQKFKENYQAIRDYYLNHPNCPLTRSELDLIEKRRKKQRIKSFFLKMVKKVV